MIEMSYAIQLFKPLNLFCAACKWSAPICFPMTDVQSMWAITLVSIS